MGQELGAQVGNDTVIVRAFEDEPVMLHVVGRDGDRLILTGDEGSHTIAFPADTVFRFSASLYDALRRAFDRRDSDQLKSLWRQAVRA